LQQAIERAALYDGLYFVFGGTVPLLNSADNTRLRGGALKATIEARIPEGLTEVIIGFSININLSSFFIKLNSYFVLIFVLMLLFVW
jgi:recombinational DNA repair protein RecR